MKILKILIICLSLLPCYAMTQNIPDNFFDNINFNDTSLIYSHELSTKIADYITLNQNSTQNYEQQQLAVILAVDHLLELASVNFEMYKFVFQFLIGGFNELGMNEIVDYMTRIPYIESIECTDDQYNEIIAITESNSRVKIGNLAENISGKTVLNDDFDLYGIDNEYVIVLFWSYTCPHCHDILIQLKEFLDNNDNFSLVSVCVKGKHNKIKRFVKKYKIRGFFYHDGLEWNSPTINDYAVTSTPSIFILNNEKIIVSKPFDFNDIMNLIK